MKPVQSSLERTVDQAEDTARQAVSNPWTEHLARFGYLTKGLVYGLVGVLAMQVTLGLGGETTDTRGVLWTIVQQPFGAFLLAVVTIGLVAYVFWRFIQATIDPEHKGSDVSGLLQRGGYALRGLAYALLAYTAASISTGSGNGSSTTPQDWTARVMAQPFGVWLIGLAGVGVIGFGLYQVYDAFTASFRKHFKVAEMSPTEATWATRISQLGLAARGFVLALIGGFLIQAALTADPNRAQGLGGALATLLQQPYGQWWLGIVALGFIAYGFYNVIEARYHRMNLA